MMLFVTVFYGVLDPKDGAFLYSNGGHLLPYRFNGHTAPTPLQATNGALLGISDDIEFSEHQIKLLPEDKLFLFSDGITEAFNWNDEAFGDGRLIDALVENSNQTPAMIVQQTVAAVERFEEGSSQSDDITAVLLSRDF
jgi:sigma-B regulation protein RsbU (phosphoserine phosphatase)